MCHWDEGLESTKNTDSCFTSSYGIRERRVGFSVKAVLEKPTMIDTIGLSRPNMAIE